jgi:thioredoxin reductase
MTTNKFDVIIIGGSYAGLATGMGLGRALRSVLIIDSGMPANRYTPHSHNFLTHDGQAPGEIAAIAKEQVKAYDTVIMIDGQVVKAEKAGGGFFVALGDGSSYYASNLVFATGIIDVFPDIPGFAESWGKSVLHCPYCHGYEVRNVPTGILGNGDYAFEFGSLISNWTSDLTIYTNSPSSLSGDQSAKLLSHNIRIVEDSIARFKNIDGYIDEIVFVNGRAESVKALYARPAFKQHSHLPEALGCEMSDDGYIKVDSAQRTTVPGIYACGDNVTRIRTLANAVSMGTTTAISLNKDMILKTF